MLHLPPTVAPAATVAAGALVFSLPGCWLSDLHGRRPVMLVARIPLAILAWPLFEMLSAHPGIATLFPATGTVTGLTALSSSAALVVVPELPPRAIRATGFSAGPRNSSSPG